MNKEELKSLQGGSFTGPFIKDMEGYLDGIAERQEDLGICPYCKKKFTKYNLLVYNKGNGAAEYSHNGRCVKT